MLIVKYQSQLALEKLSIHCDITLFLINVLLLFVLNEDTDSLQSKTSSLCW
jgi:hypothetical protein